MKIKIKDKEYELKYSFRTHMIYENCTGKTYPGNTLTDIIIFFYCCLLANNKDVDFTLDEFIDYLDVDPSLLNTFNKMLNEQNERVKSMSPKQKKTVTKKTE